MLLRFLLFKEERKGANLECGQKNLREEMD
jgi:hypothetical protein